LVELELRMLVGAAWVPAQEVWHLLRRDSSPPFLVRGPRSSGPG